MDFEYDPAKRLKVIEVHGVDVLEAALIFEGPVFTAEDRRHEYSERRWRSIGIVDGTCFVLVHTQRGLKTRLITAWKAGRNDRKIYEKYLARANQGDEEPG